MSPTKTLTFALMITASAFYAKPAHADRCCSSFWRCLGAAVTGGLSCAAFEAKQEIERLLQNAQRIKNEGDRMFDASIGELNNAMVAATRSATDHFDSINRNSVAHERQAREIYQRVSQNYNSNSGSQATRQAETSAQQTTTPQTGTAANSRGLLNHEIAHVQQQGNSGVASAQNQIRNEVMPNEARRNATQAALNRAATTSNKLSRDEMLAAMNAAQQKISTLTQDSSRGYETARRNMERVHQQAVNHMRDVFSTSFAAPMMSAVIGPLSATIVDPIAFLVTITSINRTLELTVDSFNRLFPRAINHSNGLMASTTAAMEDAINSATNRTSESGRIVNAMRELERRADRYAYSQLNDLTGHRGSAAQVVVRDSSVSGTTLQAPPTNSGNQVNPALAGSLNVQYISQFNSELSNQLRELSNQSKQLQARLTTKQNTAGYERELDNYWRMEFAGKNAQQIEMKKRELMNQINREFAKDANAKSKAIEMLNREEGKYKAQIQSSPALINPQPSINRPMNKPQVATPPGIKPIAPNNQLPQAGPKPKPVPKLNPGIQPINKPGQ